MANHGFLPRDGRNITIAMILDAAESEFWPVFLLRLGNHRSSSDMWFFSEGYNYERNTLFVAAKLGLLTSPLNADTMSLEDLKL